MLCYTHRDVAAVAECRACCKAVCHACLVDFGDGIACKGTPCEQEVRATNEAIRVAVAGRHVNARVLKVGGAAMMAGPGVLALLHVIGADPGAAVPHLFFAGLGLALYWAGRKFSA